MAGEPAAVIKAGVLLPCCDRVPLPVGGHRYVCAGCGQLYRSAASIVQAGFGDCADVTPMTPRRLIYRDHRLINVPVPAVEVDR